MKSLLIAFLVFSSLAAYADSFEIVRDGKTYVCTEKESSPISGSLTQLCHFGRSGSGQTLYYPSGKVFTYSAGTKGATWYYENGKVITYSAGHTGATWYYSNGKVLTYSAGQVGATWYYPSGKVISYSMGTAGATMYYENGQVMTYNAPAMSAEELLYACDYIQ